MLVTFQEIIDKGLNKYIKHYNRQDCVVTFENGSQFIFMAESYDNDKDLNRFRGLEINGAFIDEANEIQEVTYNKVIERSGSWFHSENCPTKIVMSANPSYNWIKELFYDRWVNGTLQAGHAYIPARIFDNPHIPEDYLESIKSLPRWEYEVFVNGSWEVQLQTGSEFYKQFRLDKHVKHLTINPTLPLHISIDSNVFPYIAVTIWQLTKINGKWSINQVYELPCSDPYNTASKSGETVANWLLNINYQHKKVFIYGDSSTKSRNNIDNDKRTFFDIFVNSIKKYGFLIDDRITAGNPSVSSTGDFINAIFEGVLNFADILINETCKKSINDYIETKQDKDGGVLKKRVTDAKTGISYEPNGHLLDTSRYFIFQSFTEEFKKYQNRFIISNQPVRQISRVDSITY